MSSNKFSSSQNSHSKGVLAEDIACNYLSSLGYSIAAKRYKTKHGEIDIIAIDRNTLVFAEVKCRKNNETHEVLSKKQMQRIANASMQYLIDNSINLEHDCRFDFIFINLADSLSKQSPKIEHITNAWWE
jgi:putative endonuclease